MCPPGHMSCHNPSFNPSLSMANYKHYLQNHAQFIMHRDTCACYL